ncbi:LysM peptidoglycan-binding domain-containing protein [Desulfosarcina sp.]|uniref:LysM peptidoglycan-binding domain-containing protein n=1 Tax=Desulfosarcina sp. TaxID=2027861 RepID=UPI00397060A2
MNRRINSTVLFSVIVLLSLFFPLSALAGEKIDVVESETGFYYTIQKGDTLWDLSKHFNDSPWLWPELWEDNDQITNPHWIFPGERIRLYKKSGAQVVAGTEPVQPVVVAPVKPAAASAQEKESAPFFVYTAIDRVGFIRKPPVTPSGTVFEVQGRKTLISEGDIVYIRPSEPASQGDLIPGSRHTVFRYMAPTDERDATETIGTQHYILGIVEVTQKEIDMVLAKVLKSFRPIQVGDLLMPFSPRHSKIELKPSTPGIEGQIITSEEHSILTGDYTLAFIDKGRADNIEVGQQYSIYNQKKLVLENNEISAKRLPPVDYGALVVLHTEQTTSTVVITNAVNTISAGERFRTPVK